MNIEEFKETETNKLELYEAMIEDSIAQNVNIDADTQIEIMTLLRRMLMAEIEFLDENPKDYYDLYIDETATKT